MRRLPTYATRLGCSLIGLLAFSVGGVVRPAAARPLPPVVIEPAVDGQLVNGADAHMATAPFADAGGTDAHRCSEWEIQLDATAERVWTTLCLGGAEAVHVHLGDGAFEGSHLGRGELIPDADYRLRVRHWGSGMDPGQSASDWAERLFRTAPATTVLPFALEDVLPTPKPAWLDELGEDVILPAVSSPAALVLDAPDGTPFVTVRGLNGVANEIIDAPARLSHAPLRIVLDAGATSLTLPASRLVLHDDDGVERTVYLPATALGSGERRFLWVSSNGSSFDGAPDQTTPDFSLLAQAAPLPWAVRQPGFRVEIVATGFQLPVNIAFVPNPTPDADAPLYYVTELYGAIKVVTRDGRVGDYATDLLNFDPSGIFPGTGEMGVTGIAVDPVTGDVLAGLLHNGPFGLHPRVLRLRSVDGGRTVASQETILDLPLEIQAQSHQISNLSIGPDGHLFVHLGDGFAPIVARDLHSFRGKIIRLALDGAPVAGSPFYDPADGVDASDYIWAFGFRNPFGGAWRAADGFLYMVGNGPATDRLARIVPGADYGWTGLESDMLVGALYTWTPSYAPVNLAFIEPQTFGGSGFPAGKMDHAFVTESGPTWGIGPQPTGKRISEFVIDQNGGLVAEPTPLVEYDGVGKATVCGLAAGPDGLYFTDLYKDLGYVSAIDRGANVLRVRFVGVADFTTDVDAGETPLLVRFTDTSTVPAPSAWRWDFGDGRTSTSRNPTHVYATPGRYDVRLQVTGPAGTVVARKAEVIHAGSTATALQFSRSADRRLPEPLSRATVAGPIFVLTSADSDMLRVTFQLDGSVRRVDETAPFDLVGDGPGGAAALDTTTLVEGAHVVRAVVEREDGSREAVVAGFTVDNHACASLLDVDGDGVVATASDCVYTARRRLGIPPVPPSFRLANPAIADDAAIAVRIDSLLPHLDLDGRDGVQVVTDVTYVARWLLGIPPVPPGYRQQDPTLPSDAAISAALEALVPAGCVGR